ncbi:kinase [Streptomyces sp. NPDC056373]|uniref:kinase n=1 Tax=Streptomyces sp. NPDC056373 TaxID=3345798 RepID=UPI0035DFDD7A
MAKILGCSAPAGTTDEPASEDVGASAVRVLRWTSDETGARATVAAELVLPPELTARLRTVAARGAVPLNAVLLAAHLRVVAALTSDQNPVTGYVPADGDPAAPRLLGARGVLRRTWHDLMRQAAEASRRPPALARIEPTDGVLYPGIVAFYHRRVALHSQLGSLPSMTVVGADEGGEIDTIAFNRIPKPFSAADREEYARLLERMATAVAGGNLTEVGEVATRSALMNQVLRPKRKLEAMIDTCRQVGGLGVVVGHSGTCLGVLLDTAEPSYPQRLVDAASACSELVGNVTVYRTLSFDR